MGNKKFIICLLSLLIGVATIIFSTYSIFSLDKITKSETFLEQFSKSGMQYSDITANYVNSEEYKKEVDAKRAEANKEKTIYIIVDVIAVVFVVTNASAIIKMFCSDKNI